MTLIQKINLDMLLKSLTDSTNYINTHRCKMGLREIKIRSPDKLMLHHLSVNSIQNKFENSINLVLIYETKLHDSFPTAQIHIKGFIVPYR